MEHPYSLKKSIPYSQALRIRRICSTFQEYHSHSRKLIEQFVNKGYKKDVVTQPIQKVDQLDRKQLLHQQKRHDEQCIPLSVTYSRPLPNLKDITKHWHILQANQSFKETFSTLPIITNKTFKIYHRVKCKSSLVIYLLECYICNIQYVGKSETPFNIRLNNHRKDVKNPNAMPACKHFNRHDHVTITEKSLS